MCVVEFPVKLLILFFVPCVHILFFVPCVHIVFFVPCVHIFKILLFTVMEKTKRCERGIEEVQSRE